jgi:hypothetical protein
VAIGTTAWPVMSNAGDTVMNGVRQRPARAANVATSEALNQGEAAPTHVYKLEDGSVVRVTHAVRATRDEPTARDCQCRPDKMAHLRPRRLLNSGR